MRPENMPLEARLCGQSEDGSVARRGPGEARRPQDDRTRDSTVRAVLSSGGNLEASARTIFVHPNTVRYRLKRAAEITGLSATDPRGSWTLQVALALARLDRDRSLWH